MRVSQLEERMGLAEGSQDEDGEGFRWVSHKIAKLPDETIRA